MWVGRNKLSQEPSELVVLLLRDVVFRHPEFQSLEDFLVEKYGFRKIEEKEQKISELRQLIPAERGEIVFEEESKARIVLEETEKRFSSLKIYEGIHLGSEIEIYILGGTTQKEDIVAEAGGEEQYTVYTVEYQMIKLVGKSGYAIQQLVELLTVNLGLAIKSKEWIFHRSREG